MFNVFSPKRRGKGYVLIAAYGSWALKTSIRIRLCLRGQASFVIFLLLVMNYNDENRRLRRLLARVPTIWPMHFISSQGFLRNHRSHDPEAERAWREDARLQADEAERRHQAAEEPVAVLLVFLSPWSGHTPIARFGSKTLVERIS